MNILIDNIFSNSYYPSTQITLPSYSYLKVLSYLWNQSSEKVENEYLEVLWSHSFIDEYSTTILKIPAHNSKKIRGN